MAGSGHQKSDPRPTLTTDLVPAGIMEKRPYLRFAKGIFFGKKSFFFLQKYTRHPLKDWYVFGKMVFFYLHNFSRSWLEHGVQNSDFCPKIRFWLCDPKFCRWPVCSPRKDGVRTTWDRFFDFLFLSYVRFCNKKNGRRTKKASPTPLWGHRQPETALALSACGLDNVERDKMGEHQILVKYM